MRIPSLVFLVCLMPAGEGAAQSHLEGASLEVGGWLQPRYEYGFRDGQENLSSFYIRRARIDLRGAAVRPELTFRIMPDVSRGLVLQDAWVNYAFSPAAQVRFGQFTVPFQWHRDIAARRQHFAERGAPSATFGVPGGRDIGVMLHGRNPARSIGYALGVFDGSGRNTVLSNSAGHLVSARLAVAVLGALPGEESDLARSADPGLAFGVGLQGATKNELRAWDLGRSPAGVTRADWVATTIDASLRWLGASLAAEAYLRRVDPDDPVVHTYDGWAYLVTAGMFAWPRQVEVVARFSESRFDASAPETRHREVGVGLNIYLRGHGLKTRVQYLTHDGPAAGLGRDAVLLVEFQIDF